jgi:hypothetical protein
LCGMKEKEEGGECLCKILLTVQESGSCYGIRQNG